MKVLPPVTITPDLVVDSNIFDTAPAAYDAGTTYAADAYASVAGTLGAITIYKSLQAANTGHTPASSPTWWFEVSTTYEEYDPLTTYGIGHRLIDPDTNTIKESTRDQNVAKPLDNASPWKYIGKFEYMDVPFHVWATTYKRDEKVIGWIDSGVDTLDHNIFGVFVSKADGNTGHATDQTVPGVTNPPTAWSGNTWWQQIDVKYPLYKSYAVYALGEKVLMPDGSIYESQIPDNSRQSPINPVQWWLDVGPSNRTACFDSQSSTQTIANKELTFTFTPGIIEAVALVNCLGDLATITVRDGLAGPIVYENTSGIAGDIVSDWYQYFFSDTTIQRTQVLFTDIPPYNSSHVTVTITGGFTVAVGDVMAGRFSDVGLTEFGVQIGIDDFSVVETDEFGQTTFVKRGNKKYMDARQWIKKADFNRAFNLLRRLPAVPCLWVAGDVQQYSEALMLKAYYKNFAVDIDGPDEAYCSLKLIGLI